jgi:hypothetical protein
VTNRQLLALHYFISGLMVATGFWLFPIAGVIALFYVLWFILWGSETLKKE